MNNTEVINDPDTVQVSAAEYKAVIEFSVKLAEQNAAVLGSIKAMTDALIAQAETQTAMMGAFRDAVEGLKIAVNVPEQPAPVVNVEQPASKRKVKMTVKRDKEGNITGVEGVEE